MRKIVNLTLIALLGITTAVYAQDKPKQKYIIAKGTKMFTGSVYGGYSSAGAGGTSRSWNFSIHEQNGFFVANNLSIGSIVSYGFNYNRYPGFDGITGTVVNVRHTPAIGVCLRYYKMFTERFGFFGQFSAQAVLGFNRSHTLNGSFQSKSHTVGLDVKITPNLVYFVTKKFAVEAGFGALGYSHTFKSSSHSVELGVRPSLNLGMSFYLGKGVQLKN